MYGMFTHCLFAFCWGKSFIYSEANICNRAPSAAANAQVLQASSRSSKTAAFAFHTEILQTKLVALLHARTAFRLYGYHEPCSMASSECRASTMPAL